MTLESRSSAILRFGVFEVDVRAGEVRKQGVRVKLQEQPFQILTILVQRPGDVVTREELRLAIWPTDTFVDFDNGLNTSINKLREALGDSGLLPIGSLGAGILAEMIGLRPTLTVGAAGLLLSSLRLVLSPIRTMRDYPHQENRSIAHQILDV